ncbi:5763_t:CDS:2, partial [Funneliformis geosporum]
ESLLFAINDNNFWVFLPNIDSNNSNKKNDSDWVANVLCEWNKSAITVQIPTTFHNIIKGGNILLHTVIPE